MCVYYWVHFYIEYYGLYTRRYLVSTILIELQLFKNVKSRSVWDRSTSLDR